MMKHLRKLGILVVAMICLSIPIFAGESTASNLLNDISFKAVSRINFQVAAIINNNIIIKEIGKKEADDSRKAKIIAVSTGAKKTAYTEADEASGRAAAETKELASMQNVATTESKPEVKEEKKEEAKPEVKPEASPNASDEPKDESKEEANKPEEKQEETKPEDSSVLPAGSLGIDVSEFNGYIDWNRVKNAGVKYAFIRVGGRFSVSGKFYNDSRFEYNITQAKAHGIKVGVYFFTQAINPAEAIEEANYTIEKIKPYNIDFPVVIDSESVGGGGRHAAISVQERTNVIKAFCDTVSNAGYTPMLYASTSWLNNKLYMNQLSGTKVWVAQYYTKVTYGGSYNIWQYTSSQHIDGVSSTYVDCNRFYSL